MSRKNATAYIVLTVDSSFCPISLLQLLTSESKISLSFRCTPLLAKCNLNKKEKFGLCRITDVLRASVNIKLAGVISDMLRTSPPYHVGDHFYYI